MFYTNKKRSYWQNKQAQLTFQDVLNIISTKTKFQPIIYKNGYKLRCPAHEDKKPSLCISEAYDKTILMHCFCGCTLRDICSSIGIEVKDLFPKKNRSKSYE